MSEGTASPYKLFKPVVIYSINPDGSLRQENHVGREQVIRSDRSAQPRREAPIIGVGHKSAQVTTTKSANTPPKVDLWSASLAGQTGGDGSTPGDLTALWAAIIALQAGLAALLTTVNTLATTVASIVIEIATLSATVATLSSGLATLESTVASLSSTLTSLESTVATLSSTVSTLSSNLDTLNTTVEGLSADLATAVSRIDVLETTTASLQSQINDILSHTATIAICHDDGTSAGNITVLTTV